MPLNFNLYKGDIRALVEDVTSEPTLKGILFAKDVSGDDWIVLDGTTKQVDPLSPKSWRGIQQFSMVHTWFVPAGQGRSMLNARAKLRGNDFHFASEVPQHIDCCYVGEIGRAVGPPCPSRQERLEMHDEISVPSVSPIEDYTWEGSLYDCSIGDSATARLPSTFLQRGASLSVDARGPSWLDRDGRVVFINYDPPNVHAHALLVRASYLQDFVTTHAVELVASLWFERALIDGNLGAKHPYMESRIEGWMGADLGLRPRSPMRSTRNL